MTTWPLWEWVKVVKEVKPPPPPCAFCRGTGRVSYLPWASPWYSHPAIQANVVERCAVCRGSGVEPRGLRR